MDTCGRVTINESDHDNIIEVAQKENCIRSEIKKVVKNKMGRVSLCSYNKEITKLNDLQMMITIIETKF